MGKLVHSGPRSSRQGSRRSTIVRWRGSTRHSTRTWWRACSGTRWAHHRCTRATSSSGRPIGLPAPRSLCCVVERVVGRVEGVVKPRLTASVGLVVGFGRHRADQLLEVVVGGRQGGALVVGTN